MFMNRRAIASKMNERGRNFVDGLCQLTYDMFLCKAASQDLVSVQLLYASEFPRRFNGLLLITLK